MDVPIERPNSVLQLPAVKATLVVLLLIAVSVAAHSLQPAAPSVKQADLWLSEVQQGLFTRSVRGVGVLAPSEIRWIAAVSAGRVERVLIKPGAEVNQDTVIAELSNPELLRELEAAKWELDAARANLLALDAQLQELELEQELAITQARMLLESAKVREKAEKHLADQFIISQLEFATTQLTTKQRAAELKIRLKTQSRRGEIAAARLAAEQANVRKFENRVEHIRAKVAALRITADIAGVLQEVSVDVGQRVEVGSNIARVAQPDSLMAELQVQENLVQDLKPGLRVSVDTRNGVVEGQVVRIDPRVINGNVQVDVHLVGQLPTGARPDLSITGTIILDEIEDALYISRPAGTSALSEQQFFTLISDGNAAEQRNVQLGQASVSSIQVLAGLQPGDVVIVSDTSDFDEHPSIRIDQ